MPVRWTIRLHAPTAARHATPAQLHGLACALFEGAGADHTSQHKPFSTSPLLAVDQRQGITELCVGWMDDRTIPPLDVLIGHQVRLGPQHFTVHHVDQQAAPYEALLKAPAERHAEITFLSPTLFTRSGRWIPLPDPELIYRSLLRRWTQYAPAPFDDPVVKELFDALVLTAHDTASEPVTLPRGNRTGFTGRACLALLSGTSQEATAAFSALTRFAPVAGVGAQTTHGLGYVRTTLTRSTHPAGSARGPGRTPPHRPTSAATPQVGAADG
ncbi:CRISPR system precrRNA processing endoribonuclease RAMP protein Cas6 [Streptomyces sp900105755]|uniref:CRISPR system precrRNA processing endoribonuclease RAMP protein Cas6 n=1 Tax=Streptomyces sp. 900105755 TaxID=3154389 RepID=A0ABV1TWM6_9ACTN